MPDMIIPTLLTVEPLGIAQVQRFEYLSQPLLGRCDCDEVDLIVHQAISENLDLEFRGVLSQPTRISKPILVVNKHIFAAIALPDYIVRYLGADGPGNSEDLLSYDRFRFHRLPYGAMRCAYCALRGL